MYQHNYLSLYFVLLLYYHVLKIIVSRLKFQPIFHDKDLPSVEMLDDELPKLGAEDVIDEVVTLLGRLESDRQDTESLLEKEKKRVVWLQGKIDTLAHKRLVELPKAVQKGRRSYLRELFLLMYWVFLLISSRCLMELFKETFLESV